MAHEEPKAIIERLDLDTLTYERVRQMILDGTLEPGKKIVQDRLAAQLGVSRTPLRRALTRLEKENLVEIRPRGGTFVRTFTPDEVIAIFEIRAVLEGLAARLFAPRVTREDVNYMKSLFDTAMAQITDDDWTAYKRADREFHTFIARRAGSRIIEEVLNSYHILTVAFLQGLIRPPHETYPEHQAIIAALKARDPVRAEQLALEHIRITLESLKQQRMTLERTPLKAGSAGSGKKPAG